MSQSSKAGIKTAADGASYIPSSKRADGSTRKEIKIRPGYQPPEDIETYKNRSAEAWKNKGQGGVPGADPVTSVKEEIPAKSKNAKRREAARNKAAAEGVAEDNLTAALQETNIFETEKRKENWRDPTQLAVNDSVGQAEVERQKKIRNQVKKLKAIRELREKRAAGEKLTHDQIMKIGKEAELLRDLKKLGYDEPDMQTENPDPTDESNRSPQPTD